MPDNRLPAAEVQSAIYQALDLVNARQVREFSVPPTTLIGPGAVGRSGDVLAERGIKHVFIMVDGMLLQAGLTDVLERNLSRSGIAYEIWPCPPGEPMDKDVFRTVEHLLSVQCDGIIALGGGSVLDAAKAVAVLAANPDLTLADMMPGAALNPRLPFIAIPTTAGTGSEATNVSVIITAENHIKLVLAHSQLLPDLAIIDACLTLGVPPHVTAMTGIDALTHAIEAYVASNVTPLTQALALRAISMISHALPIAVGQGHDIKAREDMMLASYMAGMAFSNAGLGLCHAMAHQIGAAYNIPHGKANAVMLPQVMRFNRLVCKQAYSEIGHALTQRPMTDMEAIEAVEQLISDVELAQTLPSLGGKREDFDGFAKAALQDICIKTNPRAVTAAQITAIYESA